MTTARKLPELTEADNITTIKGFMESRHWYAIRIQSGVVRGKTGDTYIRMGKKGEGRPDWIFLRAREFVLVEMKRPGKGLSKDQQAFFDRAEILGMPCIWADSFSMFLSKYGRMFTR